MQTDRSDLLRPSLAHAAPARAPYSQQTHFLSAFFGGPIGALGISALNAHRLGRLGRDAGWLLLALAVYLGFEYAAVQSETGLQLVAQAKDLVGPRAVVLASRALALGYFVLGLLVHRREQQATDLMGLPRPSGWLPGIALIIGGTLVTAFWRVLLQ